MKQPLLRPLILVGDNTSSEIRNRVRNCCRLLLQECNLDESAFNKADSLNLSAFEIKWTASPNATDYLALSAGHRTLLILDVALQGRDDTRGLQIADELLANAPFAENSIVLLKSTVRAGSAASWAQLQNLSMRQLRVSRSVRLRLLAADGEVDGETDRYEQGMFAQALLDLQEEAIFDGLHKGEWGPTDVDGALDQIVMAHFYGAFFGDKALERLYTQRVLKRYHQRLAPSYPKGPLNIGVAQVMGDGYPPTTLQVLRRQLTLRAPETVGVVSALLDYVEIAAAERLLFQPTVKNENELVTDFDEQAWKPERFENVHIIKRKCELNDARKAFKDLRAALKSCGKAEDRSLLALEKALQSKSVPDVLDTNRLIADIRSIVVSGLPAAVAELVAVLIDDIEQQLTEGLVPDIDTLQDLKENMAPELILLEWNVRDNEQLERIDSEQKRVRLLNRRLFDHPAVEAARIIASGNCNDAQISERIVHALRSYIQSPEAISALVSLQHSNPDSFEHCLRLLADTDANIRLPSVFDAFDRLWNDHWNGNPPPVLPALQDAVFFETAVGRKIADWNQSEAGKKDPIIFAELSLLELLAVHLAILEYRIRSFCTLIGHAGKTKDWKKHLAENLADLWRRRGWDRIFSRDSIMGEGANSFDPGLNWTGDLIAAVTRNPKAKLHYDEIRGSVARFAIKVVDAKPTYNEPAPIWLRIGNLALPSVIVLKNLTDRWKPTLGTGGASSGLDLLADPDPKADVHTEIEEREKSDLIAYARKGDASAVQALIKDYKLSPEAVGRLLRGK